MPSAIFQGPGQIVFSKLSAFFAISVAGVNDSGSRGGRSTSDIKGNSFLGLLAGEWVNFGRKTLFEADLESFFSTFHRCENWFHLSHAKTQETIA